MDSKPILIIKFPPSVGMAQVDGVQYILEKKLKEDYYVIVIPLVKAEEIEFELLSVKDINEVEFEEVKEMIRKEINGHDPNDPNK